MKNRTCGECKWYNKSTEKEDPIMGILHVCDKGYICNSWNLNNGCVYFETEEREMYRLNKNIKCDDENCANINIEEKCCLDPNFYCIYKLKQKLQELINNNSTNVTNPSNTYESINVIPVDEIYKFMEELG